MQHVLQKLKKEKDKGIVSYETENTDDKFD